MHHELVLVERAPWLDLPTATALADPQLDLATPLKGPFRTLPPPSGAAQALRLEGLQQAANDFWALLCEFSTVPSAARLAQQVANQLSSCGPACTLGS